MEKLTAKQRAKAKIYRKAAKLVDEGSRCKFCCSALAIIIFKNITKYNSALEKSPEFQLFSPEPETFLWWDSHDKQSRVIALLFSEQMALNP